MRRAVALEIIIAHLPFTTEARFRRKLENIREVFAYHDEYFGLDGAWHWRHWLELAGESCLANSSVPDSHTTSSWTSAGNGVIRSAADVLRRGDIA